MLSKEKEHVEHDQKKARVGEARQDNMTDDTINILIHVSSMSLISYHI